MQIISLQVKDKNHIETIFETVNLQIKTIKKFNKIRAKTALEKKREETWKKNWLKKMEKKKQQQQQQIKEKELKAKQKNEWKEKPKKDNSAATDNNSTNSTGMKNYSEFDKPE